MHVNRLNRSRNNNNCYGFQTWIGGTKYNFLEDTRYIMHTFMHESTTLFPSCPFAADISCTSIIADCNKLQLF